MHISGGIYTTPFTNNRGHSSEHWRLFASFGQEWSSSDVAEITITCENAVGPYIKSKADHLCETDELTGTSGVYWTLRNLVIEVRIYDQNEHSALMLVIDVYLHVHGQISEASA